MKIYHISDLHIGRDLGGYDLIVEQQYTLDKIVELVKLNSIKYLLLAGDIFDKYNPSNEAMALFDKFLMDLAKLSTRVIIITGNHDSKPKLSYLKSFLEKDNIYIYTSIPKEMVSFDDDKISFLPIPYLHEYELYNIYGDLGNTPNEIYEAIINNFNENVNKEHTKICLCHNLIVGGITSKSERILSVGGLDAMPNTLFKDFDYTALGHLHINQKMGDKIYYSGSIMKYSVSEFNNDNKLIEFDTDTKEVAFIPIPQYRNSRIITGEFDTILEQAKTDPYSSDFIHIELTDDGVVYDAFNRLSKYYPFIVSICTKIGKKENTEEIETISSNEIEPIDIFKEFYKFHLGEIPNDKVLTYIEKILNTVNNNEDK